jgi:hypothetical protein
VAHPRLVNQLDGDELIPRELDHGQMPDIGVRDLADNFISERGIERERAIQVGDP